ncbi:MAG: lipoyl(octanoyl) transferase LipB [Desulfonauticus sp.]|nr:lipoyl(octanoyl) transferase LipB [Desulfonauticus sp.]
MKVIDLGLINYQDCLEIQKKYLEEVYLGGENVLLVLEHFPVITFGRHGGEENLLVRVDQLNSRGIQIVKSSRGGNITCHFPGQLVAYPIFRIGKRKGGLKQFFFDLEEVVIRVLKKYQIKGERIAGLSGVFVNKKKICSIGIGVWHWISYHGLALNVLEDISLFGVINPCGLGCEMTSMHLESSFKPDLKTIKQEVIDEFKAIFT